jgi:glycosyltransferase involved in cell wall biosynthesis
MDIREAARSSDLSVVHTGRGEPQVSVLVPIFRQNEFLTEALSSVLNQSDVICEILVSDDCSGDGTAEIALDYLRSQRPGPHRVLFRRGAERLRRDHIPVLSQLATTKIVAQAHGDDLSEPLRMATLVEIFRRTGAALVATAFTEIDENGDFLREVGTQDDAGPVAAGEYTPSFEEALASPWWGLGAVQAWRPARLAAFRLLETRFAPVAHDRILPIRAAILEQAVVSRSSLVRRRQHPHNWSRELVDSSSPDRRKHGWAVHRLLIADVVRHDLHRAQERDLISSEAGRLMEESLNDEFRRVLANLRTAHASLLNSGARMVWSDEPS